MLEGSRNVLKPWYLSGKQACQNKGGLIFIDQAPQG